jgi:hypothetical protein
MLASRRSHLVVCILLVMSLLSSASVSLPPGRGTVLAQAAHPFDVPSEGVLPQGGCNAGEYSCDELSCHNGVDIWTTADGDGTAEDSCQILSKGNPIYAPYDGTVVVLLDRNSNDPSEEGYDGVLSALILEHNIAAEYQDVVPDLHVYTYYGHMGSMCGDSFIDDNITVGAHVSRGTLLGYQGNRVPEDWPYVITHLHFSVRTTASPTAWTDYRDPSPYIGVDCTTCPQTFVRESSATPSLNVAIVESVTAIHGGAFPTTTSGPTGSFTDFNFFTLPLGSLSLAALQPGGVCGEPACDTVLLNVGGSGINCNTGNITAQQKADLVSFVNSGRKLIIYDSECTSQDYSWLPYPFTTVNPGALGAQGTLTIREENTLSSADPVSPYFIDAGMLGTQTDAVGDMNVMTTYDPNWFLDMSGTNALNVTGPVHTYASLPPGTDEGLIIYNGLDIDALRTYTAPDSATPAGNLAKIWLQELQQLFNPSDLPGTNPVIGITLEPETATRNVGEDHTVTATLTDLLGEPQQGIPVGFSVESGPNAGASGVCAVNADCTTDTAGRVSFTYGGVGGVGTDQIRACFTDAAGHLICSQYATVEWQVTVEPVERRAPFDFVTELSGLVNCNAEFVLGTGEAKVDSRIDTGQLLVDVRARSLNGRADGTAGVGVRYTAPQTGRIVISADVLVEGFDAVSLVGLPKLGETGMASVESWAEISVTRLDPRRDDYHETRFASRLLTPDLISLPGSPVDQVKYDPPQRYTDSIEIDVISGDELFICAGLKSKVVATGLVPWLATAKALYGSFKQDTTRVDVITITYQ